MEAIVRMTNQSNQHSLRKTARKIERKRKVMATERNEAKFK
jgi:hypothetical protein